MRGKAGEALLDTEDMAIMEGVLETMEIMEDTKTMEMLEDRMETDNSEVVLVIDSSLLCLLE